MINTLQAGRFIAALAVVLHHAALSTTAFVGTLPDAVMTTLNFGYLGVDFFFVLSGFIIHYTMCTAPRSAGRFAQDRLIRIMLPYWPMAIVLALGYTALPALRAGDRTWGWVSTLTLIPTAHPPALSVAWTLQHELAFYLIYAVLHFSGRLWLGLAAWAMLIVAGQFAVLPEWPLLRVVLAPINVEFMAGIAAAQLLLSGRQTGWIWPVLAATLCIGAFVVTGAARDNSWIAGFAIAALLPWLCQQERDGRFSVPGWLVFGGAASYAIYLTHNPLLSVASRGFASLDLDWLGAIVAGAAVWTLFGVIYHLLWEKPVMRLARRGNQPRIRSSPG